MALVTLSAVIHREGDLYVAECPELGTVSQGKTLEEAVANLKEATGLYLEEQEEPPAFTPAILTTFSIDAANALTTQRQAGSGPDRFDRNRCRYGQAAALNPA